jgi:carboxypeptidase family protein
VMKRIVVHVLIDVLLFYSITCLTLAAQSTAEVSGTVKDQSGAVLPGVEVTATQTDTGLKRSVVTVETGSYILSNLPVGPYRLEAALPGFRTFVQTGIVLQVGATPVINPVLEVGQVSDRIEVEANAALVETRTTGVSQVMDNVRVVELPLNGRQVTDLIVLSGAATIGSIGSFVRGYPTVNISVAGGLSNGVTFLLDGASHNDPFNNLNLPLPFPDALQEFKLETSGLSAQYGQHSAGTVNAVTKSGTNEFHGNVFEFFRNGALNARNAFASDRDTLKRNQYGGTLGGPIKKNKLFFFGAYQGTKIRATPTPQFATIPTPAMVAGDWTTITSPACNGGRQITLRAPFQNNIIDPRLYSPVSLRTLEHLPVPTDPCGQVQFGIIPSTNEDIGIGKVDYQLSEKHSLFVRYELAHVVDPPTPVDPKNLLTTGTTTNGPYTTYPVVNDWKTQSVALGDTYLIGSNIVSSFRATLLRPTNFRGQPPKEVSPEELGIKGIWNPPDLANRIIGVSASGAFSFSGQGGNVPGMTNSTAAQFGEDLSWVRGKHQLGFGANYIHSLMNSNAYTTTAGMFSFTAANTGLSLGDFMLGKPNTYSQNGINNYSFRGNYFGMYLQDTWKANSHLTVNAGLRWDPYLPMYWKDGVTFHFDQKWFDQGIRSSVFTNAPAGILYSGDRGVPNSGKVQPDQWGNFSPRLGLAWDPEGNGRMTIRSSYGIFRDYPEFYKFQLVRSSPPWTSTVILQSPQGGFEDPWLGYPGGSPFPITVTKDIGFPTSATWVNVPLDLPSVYVNQWNLSIQRQMGANWLVSANYIGNSVIHLLNISEGNPAVYLPGDSCVIAGRSYSPCSSTSNTTQRRKLFLQNADQGQYFGNIVNLDSGGTMSYNGLLVTAQHRAANGLTLQANYTWSHCINTGTNQLFQNTGGYIPERRGANRGNCAGLEVDRRHNFNMSAVYALPRFSKGMFHSVLSGWQVSGIVKILSGSYVTVSSGIDNALSATNDQTPNQILASPYAPDRTIDHWLNPAAFAQPATGTYGNLGQRNIVGPGSIGIDMGLTRRFQVLEKQSLEFRAEAFNFPNHVNPNNPVTNLTSTTFGKIQSANDPRILQLALKYVF